MEHRIMEALNLVIDAEENALWTPDRLGSLAATYDSASCPVWVLDTEGRCVYQNGRAQRALIEGRPLLRFEITDHTGDIIGQLSTLPD